MKKHPHGLTLNAVCAAIDDYQRHEDSVPEEGILAAFNTLLGRSDIADALRSMERTADANMAAAQAMRDDMYHWKQRAEAAEAKLAEQKEQKADFHVRQVQTEHGRAWVECGADYERGRHFFTRPAPAINLAELVPPEARQHSDPRNRNEFYHEMECDAWNACRAAILRNIEEKK